MFKPLILVAALVLSLAVTPAQAQIAPLAGLPIPASALAELAALQLTPTQRMELMQILLRARSNHSQLQDEQDALLLHAADVLAGADPDLHQLAAEQEALTDARLAAIRQLRDELLGFHDSLAPEQQAQVHTWLLKQIGRIEQVKGAVSTLREFLANP